MTPLRAKMTFLSTSLAVMLALSTGGMAAGLPDGMTRMANMKAPAAVGYPVYDAYGEKVGAVTGIEKDDEGRARWLSVALDDGGVARVASFRAFIDLKKKEVDVKLGKDLMVARAGGEPEELPGERVPTIPEMQAGWSS